MISQSQIEAIYRARHSGLTISQISRMTGHSNRTVQKHLCGYFHYESSFENKLSRYGFRRRGIFGRFIEGYLTVRQASWLIPMTPCDTTVYNHMSLGRIRSMKYHGAHFTTPSWVNSFVREQFDNPPDGVAIRLNDLDMSLLDFPDHSFNKMLATFRVGRFRATMLWDFVRACRESGLRFEIPQLVSSRVARSLSLGAEFVLIHRGMWL